MITYNPTFKIYSSDKISNEFVSGFSTKALGDGSDPKTVESFLSTHNIPFKKVIALNQKHTANVAIYSQPTSSEVIEVIENTDGIITKESNITLFVKTADCVPILFADKATGCIGASHQGWKGSFHKLAVNMVEALVKQGAKREHIVAAIGPCIGPCCYEIYGERKEMFINSFPQYVDRIIQTTEGKDYVNLSLFNYLQLRDAGLKENNIDFFPFCTKCNEEKFYSYRREGKPLSGEMFSFILKSSQ